MGRHKTAFTQYLLASKIWDVLYTNLSDKTITNITTRYSVWVKTRRLIALHPRTKEVIDLTEVTLISYTK